MGSRTKDSPVVGNKRKPADKSWRTKSGDTWVQWLRATTCSCETENLQLEVTFFAFF